MEIITEVTDGGSTLHLCGDFDVRSTGEVRSAIDEQLQSCENEILIDLHDVECVDLTALKVLAAASHRAIRVGRHIVVTGANPRVVRLLHLTHLIRVVDLERDAAVA